MNRVLARFALFSAVLGLGCGSEAPAAKAPVGRTAQPTAATLRELPGPPGLAASLIASSASGDLPVAYAHRGGGGVVAFVSGGEIFTREVKLGGALGEPQSIGTVTNPTAFALKAHEQSFYLFFGQRIDQNHLFVSVELDNRGRVKADAVEFAPIADSSLSFADYAPSKSGGQLIYESQKDGKSSVFALSASAAGRSAGKSAPRPVLEGVLGWGACEHAGGLAFAAVKGDSQAGERGLGRVVAVLLDADGKLSPPVTVFDQRVAEPDVEIVSVAAGLLLAWTSDEQAQGAVRLAALDKLGKPIDDSRLIAPPIGEQALMGLVAKPGAERALIAWENLGQTSGGSRLVELATVEADRSLGKGRARLLLDSQERPDLVATESGFAALTLAKARLVEQPETSGLPSWPTLVRFSHELAPLSGEPLRFPHARQREGVPDAAYGLTCDGDVCYALAADTTPPSQSYLVALRAEKGPWSIPAWRTSEETRPKVLALGNVYEGSRLVATASLPGSEGGSLLSYLTYHGPDSPAEAAPRGETAFSATLGVRMIGADGRQSSEVLISRRALSTGGVSMTKSPFGKKPESVLAWVADDKGTPQVFATKIDEGGKKLAQKKVTLVQRDGSKAPKDAARGEEFVFDVAIAASPAAKGERSDGFVISWVDTRDGDPEVYAARLNKDLEKVVVDKRITQAKGAASDVSLLVRDNNAFIAFAEAREGAPADIYFSRLEASTLKKLDEDGRVYASAGVSRSPRLFLRGNRLQLAWIEEPAATSVGKVAGTLRLAELNEAGRLEQAPRTITAPDGAGISAFVIECGGENWSSCRAILTFVDGAQGPALGALGFDQSGAPLAITRLGSLTSGPFADPLLSAPTGALAEVFFTEEAKGQARIRRLSLGW